MRGEPGKERVKCYDFIAFREESVSDQMPPVREKISVGCTVFGNRITQKLAYEEVGRMGGRVNEPLIRSILEKAGNKTVSLSRENTVLRSDARQADPKTALLKALEEDCKESGWRLCALP
jgi:hypothetical protein